MKQLSFLSVDENLVVFKTNSLTLQFTFLEDHTLFSIPPPPFENIITDEKNNEKEYDQERTSVQFTKESFQKPNLTFESLKY